MNDRYFGVVLESIQDKFDSILDIVRPLVDDMHEVKSRLARFEDNFKSLNDLVNLHDKEIRELKLSRDDHNQRLSQVEVT